MEAIAKKGLNSNQLKLIAIIAMTVDHLTWVIWPGYQTGWPQLALHCVGRITAPIMWFFIAEGYHYTHSFKKYALRLLLFAVVSHFAYTFAFGIPFIPFILRPAFNQTRRDMVAVLGAYAAQDERQRQIQGLARKP